MEKKTETITGVVAVYNGKYWGKQHSDAQHTCNDFGGFDKATISNPEYCQAPTDMTYDPKNTNGYNPDFDKLSKAKLVMVVKTITTEFEIVSS